VSKHGRFRPIGNVKEMAELEGAGDAMEETVALDIEEINAEGHFGMVIVDVAGKGDRHESTDVGLCRGVDRVTFQVGKVRTIDGTGTFDVGGGDRTVTEVAVEDGMLKNGVGRAA